MYPYLFDLHLFGQHIRPPTYGVLLALGFTVGYLLSVWRALKIGDDVKHIENQFILVVFASVIGSRMFHVLFEEPSYYWKYPSKIFAIWEGGYTLYGALLLAIFSLYLYGRRNKLNFLHYADIAAPATAIGIAIGRMGCFFAGCCWGKPTELPWGVKFLHPDTFANVRNVPLHPSQVYEALGALLIFALLEWRYWRRKFEGQIVFEGLILYSLLRFTVEFFRGDDYRGYVFGGLLSYSQLVALVILPFAIAGLMRQSRREKVRPTFLR